MKALLVALVALYFACFAAGCGQSGPLYIPGDPSRIETSPPPATQEEEEEKEENGDDSDEQ